MGSVVQKKRRRGSPYPNLVVEGNDLILGSQQKREKCLLSDDSVNKPKKGKVVPCSNLDVYENDLISGSKNKREKCTTLYDSVNKPKKRRVKPKRKKLFPAGHGQKQKRRVYDTNATHLKSQSPSSSSVDQIPAALDQTVIQYQIHDMIKNLAKSKKNVTSTSHSNIHINASSKSLAEQSLIAKETEYEEPVYTKQNEMNEDIVEKKNYGSDSTIYYTYLTFRNHQF
ncbi:uncharacterized protein LOC119688488 [Teleopsis dalmanni]|uniref:uncharacterized protein LOC119664391 n=1 Tax=Teleopsis dalmanni TaxID=139649 RepID=UPI0018CF2BA8|nr:uncharacterized protein LOC119664391 [Teleopsis dalmanni]XP_037959092.1 uncharacterized protein LOC119688488 [Teleopsis dalmanni]